MSALASVGDEIGTVADAVGASVVGVVERGARGSGLVIGDGRVLTNAHNVRSREVTIVRADGETRGTTLGVDADGDLAVLEADTGNAPAVTWGTADGVAIGTPVFAVSNPGGLGLRVTFGFVSGVQRAFRGPRGRVIRGGLEHTAPLLPGSSGGALTDAEGRLIGVNTNRLGEGFYLAIPADAKLRERVDSLARGHTPSTPRIGVAVAPSDVARKLRRAVGLDEADGLLVRGVEDGSPAAAAGVREGDLIVAAAGAPTTTPDALHDALAEASAPGPIELSLLRGAEAITLTVHLAG